MRNIVSQKTFEYIEELVEKGYEVIDTKNHPEYSAELHNASTYEELKVYMKNKEEWQLVKEEY